MSLLSVPVRLYTATESKDVAFNTLHANCGSRIKQQRICPVHDLVLTAEDTVRGYEYAKGSFVTIADDELDALVVPSKHTIDLKQFVGAEEIDPVYFEKAYWLEPEPVGERPYALLLKALESRSLVGIGTITLRTRERLCALRVGGGTLVLDTLFYPDEIRERTLLADQKISDQELTLALSLVDTLTSPFDPNEHTDGYRTALMELIAARQNGATVAAPAAAQPKAPVGDLMSMLQAAITDAKAKATDAAEPRPDAIKPKRKKGAA